MSIPLSSLDTATVINDTDLILIRQGLVDKKAQAILMRTINIDALAELTSPASTDMMIISNGVQNYKIAYSNVSFPSNTAMWFYQSVPPPGWEMLDSTSGALLSVKGPGGSIPGPGSYSTPGSVQGDWQQLGTSLILNQIPPHTHGMLVYNNEGTSETRVARARTMGTGAGTIQTQSSGGTGGGSTGVALPHDHGNLWRPASHVGILARKL